MTTVYTPETQVWFTSDLHLGHDREFIWGARGFNSIQEMNEKIIKNLQTAIHNEDELYICGDVTLGKVDRELLKQIPGHVHVILGNHDTDARELVYKELGWQTSYGERIKYSIDKKKISFLLTHYPTLTSNIGDSIEQSVINLSGHTHNEWKWDSLQPFIYNVGCDANDCRPIELSAIAKFMEERIALYIPSLHYLY